MKLKKPENKEPVQRGMLCAESNLQDNPVPCPNTVVVTEEEAGCSCD